MLSAYLFLHYYLKIISQVKIDWGDEGLPGGPRPGKGGGLAKGTPFFLSFRMPCRTSELCMYIWIDSRFDPTANGGKPPVTLRGALKRGARKAERGDHMKGTWLWMVGLAVLLAGCSGIRVHQDYEPASDFLSLTSFDWARQTQEKTGDPRIDNPLRDTRIRGAVERLLEEKGLEKRTDGSPAFWVRYTYVLRRKIESDGTSGSVGFGVGSRGRHGGIAIGTGANVRDFDEEVLTLDFVGQDPETLIWRGVGAQRFTEYKAPDKTIGAINALVEKILAQFPPK